MSLVIINTTLAIVPLLPIYNVLLNRKIHLKLKQQQILLKNAVHDVIRVILIRGIRPRRGRGTTREDIGRLMITMIEDMTDMIDMMIDDMTDMIDMMIEIGKDMIDMIEDQEGMIDMTGIDTIEIDMKVEDDMTDMIDMTEIGITIEIMIEDLGMIIEDMTIEIEDLGIIKGRQEVVMMLGEGMEDGGKVERGIGEREDMRVGGIMEEEEMIGIGE